MSQSVQACFGRGVVGADEAAGERGDRRQEQDAPAPSCSHAGDGSLCEQKGCTQVDGERGVEVVDADRLELLRYADTRVADEHANRTQSLLDLFYEALGPKRIGPEQAVDSGVRRQSPRSTQVFTSSVSVATGNSWMPCAMRPGRNSHPLRPTPRTR